MAYQYTKLKSHNQTNGVQVPKDDGLRSPKPFKRIVVGTEYLCISVLGPSGRRTDAGRMHQATASGRAAQVTPGGGS